MPRKGWIGHREKRIRGGRLLIGSMRGSQLFVFITASKAVIGRVAAAHMHEVGAVLDVVRPLRPASEFWGTGFNLGPRAGLKTVRRLASEPPWRRRGGSLWPPAPRIHLFSNRILKHVVTLALFESGYADLEKRTTQVRSSRRSASHPKGPEETARLSQGSGCARVMRWLSTPWSRSYIGRAKAIPSMRLSCSHASLRQLASARLLGDGDIHPHSLGDFLWRGQGNEIGQPKSTKR